MSCTKQYFVGFKLYVGTCPNYICMSKTYTFEYKDNEFQGQIMYVLIILNSI